MKLATRLFGRKQELVDKFSKWTILCSFVYTRGHMAFFCAHLVSLCTQKYIMEFCVHKSTRPTSY